MIFLINYGILHFQLMEKDVSFFNRQFQELEEENAEEGADDEHMETA